MIKKKPISSNEKKAADYDKQAQEYNWRGPDVLFGMGFEYMKPGELVLDVGIGTGLCSVPFARAGLEIHGIDASAEMLNICKSKDVAKDLKQFNVKDEPLPYADNAFDHVISGGVFQFFGDLGNIFKEISRIIKPDGIFAFTIAALTTEDGKTTSTQNPDDFSEMLIEGSSIFMHSGKYIKNLFQRHGFEKLKELKFFIRSRQEDLDLLFLAYVAKRCIK